MNREVFEKQLYNQSSQYRKFSIRKRKSSRATTKLTCLAVRKDEWSTKKGTDKSMKNALYALGCAKRHEVTLNSEKIKPVALVIAELR